MRLGYNTNGFANHRFEDAAALLAGLGYESLAITIDHHLLDPQAAASDLGIALELVRKVLQTHHLRCVIETGARFLLDPGTKHEPTLISPDAAGREQRRDFLRHAINIAHYLQADCVSLWSGVLRDDISREQALLRLVESLHPVVEYAAENDVILGFEPEPGMLIATMDDFAELDGRINHDAFQLTLDVGHLHCLGEAPIADMIRKWGSRTVNVHIEDMVAGIHEHLMFGEGQIDFEPIIAVFQEIGYQGGLHVELSRHSHLAPQAARRAYDFLSDLL